MIKFSFLFLFSFVWIMCWVSGCAVGPDYHPPEMSVPDGWIDPLSETVPPSDLNIARWWMAFNDPVLESLIERAISSNLDLKLAESRIRQARAVRGIAASGLGPTLSAVGSFQRSRTSAGGSGATDGSVYNQYQDGFDASWELDIFGGVRRNVEAAEANIQAAVENRRDVLVTLTAETAVDYINLRTYQQQVVIAQNNLEAQQRTSEITKKKLKVGFVTGLDTANADALMATTAAQIPVLESSARQAVYSLSLLIGREPSALLQELSETTTIPPALPVIPAGIPSDLLRRRPDIRMTEAQIHAATANIGVATAALFPQFNFSASAGFLNNDFSSWMSWVNRFWSWGPSANWTIFNMGSTRSNIEQQKSLEEQAVITYQTTVLTALQEVENALISFSKENEHHKSLAAAVSANRKAVDLSTQLYAQGLTDFLSVLQAELSLYSAENALVQSTGASSSDLVALYKALGGGWEEVSAKTDSSDMDVCCH